MVARCCLLLSLFLLAAPGSAQRAGSGDLVLSNGPGAYGVAKIKQSGGIRNGPEYGSATIYYPTDAKPPYASIVIVPGFRSFKAKLKDWGPYLASHGIVTMLIGTNNIFQNPPGRGEALLDAVVSLKAEHSRVSSPLNGRLDTSRVAVGGWSMGGGGAQLAAASDSSIRAVVALCPYLFRKKLSPSDLDHGVPLLIFAGEKDFTAPTASQASVHYELTPAETDKLIYEVKGRGHRAGNHPANANGDVGRVALAWLKKYLVGEVQYCAPLLAAPPSASEYETNLECDREVPITGR
ncbi:poly(ethylene terephthalate) hydrolase family protein [Neolewinella antarctica]|uniref:Dienelactone hydrolase n=1 Tax=Neolewinella antarctica TaxID=442734 RepID=A0ABX0XA31_9BACT|nr:dienelactone hydrolase family protein [Neolewinella antarctica]NJC25652.1 dienelactone hydrolase [Neolewinella antarctica]